MINNKTKKFKIVENSKICSDLFSIGFGLMFRPKPNYGLVFAFNKPRRVSLTMWFVFYPIDVLYLDENKKVVEIKKDFKPFTNYNPKNIAKYVIEFKTGLLKDTAVGDLIEF